MKSIKTIHKILDIDDYIMSLDASKTIIFMDIDNTIIRTVSDIGSVEWVRWQEALISNFNGKHKHCVASDHQSMYNLYRKWLNTSECNTEFIEPEISDLLSKYHKYGFKIIFITARDQCTAETTFKQLNRHIDINMSWNKDLYFKNTKVLYKNGVYFISGTMKGEFINYLLKIINLIFHYEPQNIVFIDDTTTECISVAMRFEQSNINAIVFNYLAAQKFQIIFDEIDKNNLHTKWIEYKHNLIKMS